VRTFLVLYLGEIHLLAEPSNMSITKFTDLADKWVGDYGGSIITARVLLGEAASYPMRCAKKCSPIGRLGEGMAGAGSTNGRLPRLT
jgi:hypothetical protein